MKTRPLGCMTFSALVAGVIALLAIAGVILATGNTIFSPGELNAVAQVDGAQTVMLGGVSSHAGLEGRCDACHAPIWSGQRMGDRCMTCHADVAKQAQDGTGLHGKLSVNAGTCLSCHTEHHGPSAPATLADPQVFPHATTGFALTSHLQPAVRDGVTCRQCHPASPRSFASQDCVSCHTRLDAAKMAVHTDTYGAACLNCHDGKETYGQSFGHTTYALVEQHSAVGCASCHKGSTTIAALRATSTSCVSCHGPKNIHQGRLGTSCEQCHSPKGWDGATLNHDTQTTFALAGKHATTDCASCHVNRQWTGLGTTCASCHQKDDPHSGKFGTDCASCHNPSSWQGATFDHSVTGFALTASHAGVSCDKCHANHQYANTPTSCVGCHAAQDAHKGAFGTVCETCHTPTSWTATTVDHSVFAFKLTGAHLGVTCQKCHTGGNPKSTPTTCVACHGAQDPHKGSYGTSCETCHSTKTWAGATVDHSRFAFKLNGAHASLACARCHAPGTNPKSTSTACASCHAKPASHDTYFGGTCNACHTTAAWTPAAFDHSKTTYKLTGAHLSATCQKCHTKPALTFQGAPSICEKCHTKPADHTGAMGTNCAQCHSTKAWNPSTFSHATTSFPLQGAHTSLLCTKCHTSPTTFGGLSPQCASCHSRPSSHPAFYGTTCTMCHTQTRWTPIAYTAAHTFPITHRTAGGICTNCHTSSFTAYTCAKCHDPARIDGHAGRSSSTCATCHPTGTGGG